MRQFIAKDAVSTIEFRAEVERQVDGLLAWLRPQLVHLALGLRAGPLFPAMFCAWELQVLGVLREFGRRLLEATLGSLENEHSAVERLSYEGAVYRRLRRRTPNAFVATLFGTIRLWRFPYRPRDAAGEPCVFPLELSLGLLCGATPALADLIGRQMAEAGATQNRVREFLWQEHSVRLGVKRLRLLVESLSAGLAEHRQAAQVEALCRALRKAADSRGNRVLHSAAALAARGQLGKTRAKKFRTAYNYLRRRTRWMRYKDYKAAHIPLGSGITEAACKTVFTQRLKLSGMRWTRDGARQILALRTVLLSRTWDATYAKFLAARATALPAPYALPVRHTHKKAA